MSSIAPGTVVAAADGLLSTTVDDELVLLDPEAGTYHGLRGVGPEVWERIQEPTTVSRVVEAVLDDYEVEAARCRRETSRFLGDLVEAGLVEVVDGPDG